jgi:hypothetical protein
MTTLDSDTVVHDLLSRLHLLCPETKARWGRMNAHQMVCHLTDSFGLAMGVKTASEDITFLSPHPGPLVRTSYVRTLAKGFAHAARNG